MIPDVTTPFLKTNPSNRSAVFGEMCRICPDVNKPEGTDAPDFETTSAIHVD